MAPETLDKPYYPINFGPSEGYMYSRTLKRLESQLPESNASQPYHCLLLNDGGDPVTTNKLRFCCERVHPHSGDWFSHIDSSFLPAIPDKSINIAFPRFAFEFCDNDEMAQIDTELARMLTPDGIVIAAINHWHAILEFFIDHSIGQLILREYESTRRWVRVYPRSFHQVSAILDHFKPVLLACGDTCDMVALASKSSQIPQYQGLPYAYYLDLDSSSQEPLIPGQLAASQLLPVASI